MKLTKQRLMEMAGIASPMTESKWDQKEFDESVRRLFQIMEEEGAYGDPDVKEVERLLKANKLEDAAELFLEDWSDPDGGEVDFDYNGLKDDVMAEFSNQVSLSNLKEVAYALGTSKLDPEEYDRIDGLTNERLLMELIDKAIAIQDDQIKAGDEFHKEDLALYLGLKIYDRLS
tara:strand:- start:50 stop:571 length:522 start_codon:yes stop_codon:yes gene_type:complete